MRRVLVLIVAVLFLGLMANCTQTEAPDASNTDEATSTQQAGATQQQTEQTESTPEKSETSTNDGESLPNFPKYPAEETFNGKTAPLILTAETRTFRSRLESAAKESPNFAGQYIITAWGCGTDCLMGGVIDAKTGNTYMIPFSICCLDLKADEDMEKIEFRKDSKLIKFNGLIDEKESETKTHFYIFENNKFTKVSKDK